jgi:cytochrome P450
VIFFDPFASATDPFAAYAKARAAGGVVPGLPPYPELDQAIYVFRHAQVSEALRHPKLLQAPPGTYDAVRRQILTSRVFAAMTRSMLLADPPHHGALRRPTLPPLAPGRLAELTQWMRAEAATLAQTLATRGRFDAVADLATPFIVRVLARVLGMVLPETKALKRATASIAAAIDVRREPPGEESDRICAWLESEIEAAIAHGAIEPGGIVAAMLAEEQAGRWEHADVIANLVLLLLAGQETTIDAFGNALLLLDAAPEQRLLLERGAVGWVLATEELLRMGGSVHYAGTRIAAEDLELGGTAVREGMGVVPVVASANRDSALFPQGDSLDLQRPPRTIMSFGSGLHTCIGQHLARLDIAILLEALFTHLPSWRVERTGVKQRPLLAFRGPAALPLVV